LDALFATLPDRRMGQALLAMLRSRGGAIDLGNAQA
jgi:hypothetical protein